jgi:hypothetical protein
MIKGGGHWYALLLALLIAYGPESTISVIFRMRKVCKQKIRKRGLLDGSTWATI